MAQLALDRDFLADFAQLERAVQQRVSEAFAKFENATHTGTHLEKISGLKDTPFRTIRIDRFWRGVVLAPESGDTYTLLAVLPHDDAYEWARRRRASVNTATGRIEIRDVAAIDASMPQLERVATERRERLFDHIGDAELRRLGVDEQTLAFARALTNDFQLDAARVRRAVQPGGAGPGPLPPSTVRLPRSRRGVRPRAALPVTGPARCGGRRPGRGREHA